MGKPKTALSNYCTKLPPLPDWLCDEYFCRRYILQYFNVYPIMYSVVTNVSQAVVSGTFLMVSRASSCTSVKTFVCCSLERFYHSSRSDGFSSFLGHSPWQLVHFIHTASDSIMYEIYFTLLRLHTYFIFLSYLPIHPLLPAWQCLLVPSLNRTYHSFVSFGLLHEVLF